jgi:hypothetical protein
LKEKTNGDPVTRRQSSSLAEAFALEQRPDQVGPRGPSREVALFVFVGFISLPVVALAGWVR